MEANFYRCFIQETASAFTGKRIEKLYQPRPGLWSLKLGARDILVLAVSAKHGCLFRSASKPENPSAPPAEVQWWRKRLQGRRVVGWETDWPNRRVALQLTHGQAAWLILDLRNGLALADELGPDFGREPDWPAFEDVLADPAIFRQHPQITPPLRKTLQVISADEASALFGFLSSGGRPETYHLYLPQSADRAPSVLPWALPSQLAESSSHHVYTSAEAAARDAGWAILDRFFFGRREAAGELSKRQRKLEKSLERLKADEERLARMAELRSDAELLQAQLYRFDGHASKQSVQLTDLQGRTRRLELDPRLTILQNMQRLFERAKKGDRGLDIVRQRRRQLEQELKDLKERGSQPAPAVTPGDPRKQRSSPDGQGRNVSARWKGIALHTFHSSDGYTILRGKNSKANHQLLSQAAKPFDYWFHAQNGPGAHVVLRRDHEGQVVPRRSLLEAAALAGLASHQAGEAKARVICALVKNVRTQKGAPLGQVQVDALEESLVVELDAELEKALKTS